MNYTTPISTTFNTGINPVSTLFSSCEKCCSGVTDYKFNAKELDNETGLYYYGARYYTPELSIWLSVDPLSDKYPNLSSYSYCSNNPVILIDPDGMAFVKPPSSSDYAQYNISEQGQQRFDAVLRNIESFSSNENFMSAFSQTTGLDRSQIEKFLTYGDGPTVNIVEGSSAWADGADNFSFGADMINYLGSIDANDQSKLGTQAFGVAMTIVDELSHNGDMMFNNTHTSTGERADNPGKQNWPLSPTFHRGGDSQIFGFGVETKTTFSGQINVLSPFTNISNPYSGGPLIPTFDMNKKISIGLKLLE